MGFTLIKSVVLEWDLAVRQRVERDSQTCSSGWLWLMLTRAAENSA